MEEKKDKLRMWQGRLTRNETAYTAELGRMDKREEMYLGSKELTPMVARDKKHWTPHGRNICAEIIEAQVNSAIPKPKVTARRKKDEAKAKLIEDMLRNELDRLPVEQINDMMERTVPIQGGSAILLEWDNTERTHYTVGELSLSVIHPKQIIPQDGVYTGVEDMDYIILKIPQTKEYIKRRYDVDVSDEIEEEPEIKGRGTDTADDMVTQYIAYYRNDDGGIGLYSWVNDSELEDLEDYQARRLRRCTQCGAVEQTDGGECPSCGGNQWESNAEEYEEIYVPVQRRDGSVIPGAQMRTEISETEVDELGLPIINYIEEPTKVPFYKPDIYPIIMQKNVSVYGKFLGDSDVDKIADQQNTTNRIEAKIIDKLLNSGSYITLPNMASIPVDPEEGKVIRMDSAADKAILGVYNMEANIDQDLVYLKNVYEEARQIIGITDSFQGRRDTTATSGKAKEFMAAQAAGRLESKKVMKDAAYANLFEAMFKFMLAYADEPRTVRSRDLHGDAQYDEFDRYDFLEQDEAGNWCWNDQFLFSTDTSAPLASNREAMWQETRMNLQTGAFGDPSNPQTLSLFWAKMEMLHYPGAGETKSYLDEEIKRQQAEQQRQAEMKRMAQMRQVEGEIPDGVAQQVMEKARRDAQNDAMNQSMIQ